MRRARPIAGCGTSPSPAISFDVSTITTRFLASSANTRAVSRRIVVFPTPGLPKIRTLLPDLIRSSINLTEPYTALPTLQVSPTGSPARFLTTEMR